MPVQSSCIVCLLVVNCALGLPLKDSEHAGCDKGFYRNSVGLCAPCPKARPGASQVEKLFIKSFAKEHPECPADPDGPDERVTTTEQQQPTTQSANGQSTSPKNSSQQPPNTTADEGKWDRQPEQTKLWIIAVSVVPIGAIVFCVCLYRKNERFRRQLSRCLPAKNDRSNGCSNEDPSDEMPLNVIDRQANNQDSTDGALNRQERQADNQDSPPNATPTRTDVTITGHPRLHRFDCEN